MKLSGCLLLPLLLYQSSDTAGGVTVTASLGDTVQLPCTFPFIHGVDNLFLLWERMDDNSKMVVHRFRKGRDDLSQQDPQYTGRTALSRDLSQGNLTLTLTNVTLRDGGTYYCRGANQRRDDSISMTLSIKVPEYIQTGSDVTRCDMKCPDEIPILLLSRRCGGGEEERLLQLVCHIRHTDRFHPRLRLDTDSGCWTLPQAGRGDSCVYELQNRGAGDKVLSSTSIRVLDPVLIYNMRSNCSRLGEDIAVTVLFSGEESHVTWELDGGRLPERYRLIDDNRTLVIPSVQRDDAERTFRVRVTNPVSEEVRDHWLQITDSGSSNRRSHEAVIAALLLVVLLVGIICAVVYQTPCRRRIDVQTPCRKRRRDVGGVGATDTDPLSAQEEGGAPTQNGSTSTNQDEPLGTTGNGLVLTRQTGPSLSYEDTEETTEPHHIQERPSIQK